MCGAALPCIGAEEHHESRGAAAHPSLLRFHGTIELSWKRSLKVSEQGQSSSSAQGTVQLERREQREEG